MRQLGITSEDAAIALAAVGDVTKSPDSHDNVLSNRPCMPPQRGRPQGLEPGYSSFTPSTVNETERGIQQLGIVSDHAASSPAAVGDVTQSPDSHDNVLGNRPCLPPQR